MGLSRSSLYTDHKTPERDAALDALTRMDKPRWRRPNAAGNLGIVTGCSWTALRTG